MKYLLCVFLLLLFASTTVAQTITITTLNCGSPTYNLSPNSPDATGRNIYIDPISPSNFIQFNPSLNQWEWVFFAAFVFAYSPFPSTPNPPDFIAGNWQENSTSPCGFQNISGDGTQDFLPVELTTFDALADGASVRLGWTTASETNNAGFEVQHQAPSQVDFSLLDFIPGNGTTIEPQTYAFLLQDLTPGIHRFRLKQVDFDGTFDYSPVIEVALDLPGRLFLSEVYPNPFNPEATVSFSTAVTMPVTLTLFDLLGRPVASLFDGISQAQQTHSIRIDGTPLATGTYLLRLDGDGMIETRLVSLLK